MRQPLETIRLAYLDNTLPKKKLRAGYARGEREDRLGHFTKKTFDGISIVPTIFDPLGPPWNPLRYKHALFAGIDPLRAVRVRSRIRDFDVVLAVGESSSMALLALRRLFPFRAPVLVMDPALDYSWKPRRLILDYVLPRADRILVRGTNQSTFLIGRYGRRCRPVEVFHAIDTGFYQPQDVAVGDYVLTIGNDIGRDFRTLIEAVRGLDVQVVLKTNEISIPESQLPDNVKLIRDRVSFDELKRLYAESRFVVVPLRDCVHASGVNSVLEAMAMGKATIISSSQGIRDYFIADTTSIVVPPEDAGALRRAIQDLNRAPVEAARLGAEGRKFVSERYAKDIYLNHLVSAIAEAVRQKAQG